MRHPASRIQVTRLEFRGCVPDSRVSVRALRRMVFVFAALLVGGSTAIAADRELGGFVGVGLRPDFLTSAAGDSETFVLATSTSSYQLSVVDTSLFEDLGPFDYLADAATRARGLAASPDGVTGGIAAVVSNDGYVDYFLISDLELAAQTGASPVPEFHKADLDNEALAGLAIDGSGTRTFAGVVADETVAINTIANGLLTSSILVGHAPLSALTVNTGFVERVFFGCDDGFLAWVDTLTLAPAAVDIAADLTHRLTVMATADFGGGAIRLLLLDETDDTLYVIDPAGPTILDSAALGANAVALASSGSGTGLRIWVAFDDVTGGHRVEALDGALANAQPDVTLPAAPLSLAERDGRLFVGLTDNRIAVVSDLPFVEITSATPDPLTVPDADVVVTFVSSQSGTAHVLLNGDELESIAVTAGVEASVTLAGADVEDVIELGFNRVRVQVDASAGGLVGHDEEAIVFDEAPGAPRNFEVGFGDARVIGRWDAPAGANDIERYVVTFGKTAGAPCTEANGTPGVGSPADVQGTQYVVNVSNGTQVFMSVLAVDSGGNSSASTTVKCATAQPTVGAAELAGDDGGFLCSVGGLDGKAAPFAAAIALGLLALLARRGFRPGGASS